MLSGHTHGLLMYCTQQWPQSSIIVGFCNVASAISKMLHCVPIPVVISFFHLRMNGKTLNCSKGEAVRDAMELNFDAHDPEGPTLAGRFHRNCYK